MWQSEAPCECSLKGEICCVKSQGLMILLLCAERSGATDRAPPGTGGAGSLSYNGPVLQLPSEDLDLDAIRTPEVRTLNAALQKWAA
jgi:hypothetical protein